MVASITQVAADTGQPVVQQDFAVDFAALLQASRDRTVMQQLLAVGMHLRAEVDAACGYAGADVGGLLGVHRAVDVKSRLSPPAVQLEVGDAFGRVGISQHRIEEPQVKIALH